MNIRFNYLYRDAGNHKQFDSVIFAGTSAIELSELEAQIQAALISEQFFVADDVGLRPLQIGTYDSALDHDWHEFESIEYCDDPCTDSRGRDIATFISDLRRSQQH